MKKLALSCAIAGAMMSLCASVQAAEPIDPIEPVEVKNPALVELGKMLFFEPRLSRSGFISCNSCHNLATGGVDNLQTSIGDRWAQGPINSPTVLNSFGHFFWVGFYLVKGEELVLGPFQGPIACTRIRKGRGVCGTSWAKAETLVVPDVDAFPGHIACSSLSRSEIVVPLIRENGEVWGVLDIDSENLNTFDEIDARFLGEICSWL